MITNDQQVWVSILVVFSFEGISFRKSVGESENNLTVVCIDTEIWTRYFPCKVRCVRLRLKCDGTSAETTFRLPAKRTSPFKSAGASVQSPPTGSRGVSISSSNAGYPMFRASVKTHPIRQFPLHFPSATSTAPCRQRWRPVTYDAYQSVPRWRTWGRHLWRRSSLLLISQVQNSS